MKRAFAALGAVASSSKSVYEKLSKITSAFALGHARSSPRETLATQERTGLSPPVLFAFDGRAPGSYIGPQVSVWRPVKVDYSIWCKSVADARLLEKAIHSTLAEDGKWLNGEWFDMRPAETKELIQFKAAILGVECFDTVTDPAIVSDIERMLAYYSDGELAIRINRYRA